LLIINITITNNSHTETESLLFSIYKANNKLTKPEYLTNVCYISKDT